MLGYVISEEPGQTDAVLHEVAGQLLADSVALIGAVQDTQRNGDDERKSMSLRLLPDGPEVAISQSLGRHSQGCNLDPEGLEHAAGLIAAGLENAPQLVLLNKFGKQEAEGQGFRPIIAEALSRGIPVILGVGREKLPAFLEFSGDLAQPLARSRDAILQWCRDQMSG